MPRHPTDVVPWSTSADSPGPLARSRYLLFAAATLSTCSSSAAAALFLPPSLFLRLRTPLASPYFSFCVSRRLILKGKPHPAQTHVLFELTALLYASTASCHLQVFSRRVCDLRPLATLGSVGIVAIRIWLRVALLLLLVLLLAPANRVYVCTSMCIMRPPACRPSFALSLTYIHRFPTIAWMLTLPLRPRGERGYGGLWRLS